MIAAQNREAQPTEKAINPVHLRAVQDALTREEIERKARLKGVRRTGTITGFR